MNFEKIEQAYTLILENVQNIQNAITCSKRTGKRCTKCCQSHNRPKRTHQCNGDNESFIHKNLLVIGQVERTKEHDKASKQNDR